MQNFKKISENIYYLQEIKEKDYPNMGYIKGDKFSIMIDGGASHKQVDIFKKAVKEKGFSYPKVSVITHWHWDHTYGMSSLLTNTIVHSKTQEKLEEMSKWSWTLEDMNKRLQSGEDIEFAHENILKEFNDLSDIKILKGDIVFNDKLSIDLGNLEVEIFHTEAPHSDDSVLIFIPKEKVLFLGDCVSKDYYNNMSHDKDKIKLLIENIKDIDFKIGILGHNEPIEKDDLMKILYSFVNLKRPLGSFFKIQNLKLSPLLRQ